MGKNGRGPLIALDQVGGCASACKTGQYTPTRGRGALNAPGALFPPCRRITVSAVAHRWRLSAVAAGCRASRSAASNNPHSFRNEAAGTRGLRHQYPNSHLSGGSGDSRARQASLAIRRRYLGRGAAGIRTAEIFRYDQGESSRVKAPRIQAFAVAEDRSKETRGDATQDQACTPTSVRLAWRQDVVVRKHRTAARCTGDCIQREQAR